MSLNRFRRGRKAAVSVLFAAAAIPMIGLVGLAVDFGIWNQSNAQLAVAANVAALTAVKITANSQLAGDTKAVAEGQTAGQQWFEAEVGINGNIGTTGVQLAKTGAAPVNVQVKGGTTVTATVTYSGKLPSIFGGILFGVLTYPISGTAAAVVSSAPYLDVEIMLDNSGSMEIGATSNDIQRLQEGTPCSLGGAIFTGGVQVAGQGYNTFQTSAGGNTYTGGLYPVPAGPPLTFSNFTTNPSTAYTCKGVLPKQADGTYPLAGPPCAFACHQNHTGTDYYAVARATSGSANPIVLRIDLVKAATNLVIAAMKGDNISTLSNLQVGIFTFADVLTKIYPTSICAQPDCSAGNDWDTATALVGAPPTIPGGLDSGIQPYCCADQGVTDTHGTMTSLAAQLPQSGDGTQPTTPRRVLFIVSDGMDDWPPVGGRVEKALSPADCALFKNMGYTVYVVYTPYVPLMNSFYLTNLYPIVETTGSNSLAVNLQSCASSPTDYIAASSGDQLNAALQTFLKAALNSPARFTM
jgi:Flp pilus assembly protein TadG